jgi:hypothetical protein
MTLVQFRHYECARVYLTCFLIAELCRGQINPGLRGGPASAVGAYESLGWLLARHDLCAGTARTFLRGIPNSAGPSESRRLASCAAECHRGGVSNARNADCAALFLGGGTS